MRKTEAFGPRGLMLVGLGEEDVAAVRRWLQLMEPGFVVRCCPAAALSQAADSGGHRTGPLLLRQALLGEAAADGDAALTAATLHEHPWEAQPGDAPPVAFFSGMSGEETVAVMEGWAEHTGLAAAPAFASVTNAILGKPLRRLLADIVRAQAQAPPPGYDAEVIAEVNARAAAAAAAGPTRTAAAGGDGTAGGAASVAATVQGGETALRSNLADYVMLGGGGAEGAAVAAPAAPMSLDQLKEQIQEKMQQKRAQQAAADKEARRAASQNSTDVLRQTLRGGGGAKKKKGGGGGGGVAKGGGGSSKGFGK